MDAERAYQTLLRLYPADYRALFATEMANAFAQAAADRRRQSQPAFLRFLLGELIHLPLAAAAEWSAKLTTNNSVRQLQFAGACPPDLAAQARIAMLIDRTVHAIANHDFPGARRYANEERQAREELRRLRSQFEM